MNFGGLPIAEAQDALSRGKEIEVNFNPTNFWTLKFNATQNETIQAAIATDLTDYLAERAAVWESIVDQDTKQPWFTSSYAGGQTAKAYLPGNVTTPLGIAQLVSADLSGGLVDLGLPVFLAILYSGTLAAGFANVIVFHGVKLLGPTRVTALQFLVPALAVAMAAIFLGEPIRPIQVVGGVIILAGVALLRRGSWPSGGARAARAIGAMAR